MQGRGICRERRRLRLRRAVDCLGDFKKALVGKFGVELRMALQSVMVLEEHDLSLGGGMYQRASYTTIGRLRLGFGDLVSVRI